MKQTRSKDSGPEKVDSPAEKEKVDVSADGKNDKEDITSGVDKEDITSGVDKEANSSLNETTEGNGKEKEEEKEVKVEVEAEAECIGGRVIGESLPRKLNGVAGREQCLAMDEMSGVVEFRAIYNDGTRASMKSLILLKVGTVAVIDDGIVID